MKIFLLMLVAAFSFCKQGGEVQVVKKNSASSQHTMAPSMQPIQSCNPHLRDEMELHDDEPTPMPSVKPNASPTPYYNPCPTYAPIVTRAPTVTKSPSPTPHQH